MLLTIPSIISCLDEATILLLILLDSILITPPTQISVLYTQMVLIQND